MRASIDLVNQKANASASADDVFEAVHRVMHLYRSALYAALSASGQELTHMDAKVLGFFARHPGATQKQLAQHSGRDKGQLARLVGGLKERGLLDARIDDADRRHVLLELTAEGRAVQQAIQRQSRKFAERAAARLSAEERGQLLGLLSKLGANLEEAA